MEIDYSNGAEIVAVIEIGDCAYIFDAQSEDEISDFLYSKIGEKLHEVTNIPLFMEASSWCALASVGEVYDTEFFKIYIEDAEQ